MLTFFYAWQKDDQWKGKMKCFNQKLACDETYCVCVHSVYMCLLYNLFCLVDVKEVMADETNLYLKTVLKI